MFRARCLFLGGCGLQLAYYCGITHRDLKLGQHRRVLLRVWGARLQGDWYFRVGRP